MTEKQKLTVEAFLEHIKKAKSKGTFKEYKSGIEKFAEFYGKSANEILEERRADVMSGDFSRNQNFSKELEEFHKWLRTPQPNREAYSILHDCHGSYGCYRIYLNILSFRFMASFWFCGKVIAEPNDTTIHSC
jgi:hypothetical protein